MREIFQSSLVFYHERRSSGCWVGITNIKVGRQVVSLGLIAQTRLRAFGRNRWGKAKRNGWEVAAHHQHHSPTSAGVNFFLLTRAAVCTLTCTPYHLHNSLESKGQGVGYSIVIVYFVRPCDQPSSMRQWMGGRETAFCILRNT